VRNRWDDGYCADVSLVNESDRYVTGWWVVVDVPDGQVYTQWNTTLSPSTGYFIGEPVDWNREIAPGGATGFGFCVSGAGPSSVPSVFAAEPALR
jgi:cellulase/cellobiase CelA1